MSYWLAIPPPRPRITIILDTILPLTKEDKQCGFKKAKKLRARAELALLIQEYKEGKDIDLPEQVLNLLK